VAQGVDRISMLFAAGCFVDVAMSLASALRVALVALAVGQILAERSDDTSLIQQPVARPSCRIFRGAERGDEIAYSAWSSHNWGNLLSEFWEVRAKAALWGKSFRTSNIATWTGTWLRYLPEQAPAAVDYKDWKALQQICDAKCQSPMFPHKCVGSWTHIRGLIIKETQEALQTFSQKEHAALPQAYSPTDVVVHLRWELGHQQMSWPGRSFFEGRLPKDPAQKVTIVHQPTAPPYESILAMYKKLLKDVCGGCQVEEQTTTQFNDFATLALAPTVFCASSTFCLWAGMGNPGTVYFPGEFMADGQCPEMCRNFVWVKDRSLGNGLRHEMPESDWVQKILAWVPEN